MHPAAFRELIAKVIEGESANRVPALCSAIGLREGNRDEAMNSKFRYAHSRLEGLSDDQLLKIGRELERSVDNQGLRAAIQSFRPSFPPDSYISQSLALFNSGAINSRWQEALSRRETNPEGAITIARTLLEDACKHIIVDSGETGELNEDLPKLYRRASQILSLAPDQHTEQAFRQILGNCQSIVETLGTIRNKISDAHSVGPLRARPSPRHAALAVNLAGAMAAFLAETLSNKR